MIGQYLKVQTRRGGGKTSFALTWAKAQVLAGAKHLLLAASNSYTADGFRDEMRRREPELFLRIKLQAACPQRDEFRLHGSNYDAAIAEDIDFWSTVFVDPNDPGSSARYIVRSVLFDEILAHTRGPVLFTYTDPDALLVQQIPSPT